MAKQPETTPDDPVNRLARIMDPEAWGLLPDGAVMGMIWDQTQRQMATIEYARRVIEAGWRG